ncbi:MAG: ASKHA domain-containing protein, partial [Nitrososphaerota archaeon]
DIRKIQLSKAAIFSAFITLLRIAKISIEDIERVFVAGAFGNYLDIFAAQILGMLPDIPRDRFSFIGNGSLAGAEMMLLSKDIEDHLQEIIKKTKVIELNIVKDFQKEFIDATQIPHARKELFRNVINEAVSLR